MKRIVLQFITVLFLLALAGCHSEDITNEDSTPSNRKGFTLVAEIPGGEQTQTGARLSLTEETEKVALAWETGDKIFLAFLQGEGSATVAAGDTVSVTEVTNNGKTASFNFSLPGEINPGDAFTLHGVYGGEGLDTDNPVLTKLPSNAGEATSLNDERVSKNTMLYFQTAVPAGSRTVSAQFNHIGSLFKISVRNTGDTPLENITGARLVGQDANNTDWAYNHAGGGKFNLATGKFEEGHGTAGDRLSFAAPKGSIAPGETIALWAWYPPHPGKAWPELKLELLHGPENKLSVNSKPKRAEATLPGKVFNFYAAWDGSELKFTDNRFRDIDEFEIGRGINIASWLSAPKYTGAQRLAFFQERDVEMLAGLGFDHIRLCVDEAQLWNEDGTKIRTEGFNLLHDAIRWCSGHGMRVIVDLHTTRSHRFTNTENTLFTDPSEPAKFVKLWEDLSDELYTYPNSLVAYELLNEPVSADPENWNRVSAQAVNAIRAREADRTIIVGVCTSSFAVRYDKLTLPSTHRIMMTFHFYGPYLLTYYGHSSTTNGHRDIPLVYPSQTEQLIPEEHIHRLPANWQETGRRIYNKDRLKTSIMLGIDRAGALGVPVFVGEFGTWNVTPEPARSSWYRDVVDILDENGTPYTSWDYKGYGYSIVSESNRILYPGIVKILTGNHAFTGNNHLQDIAGEDW